MEERGVGGGLLSRKDAKALRSERRGNGVERNDLGMKKALGDERLRE